MNEFFENWQTCRIKFVPIFHRKKIIRMNDSLRPSFSLNRKSNVKQIPYQALSSKVREPERCKAFIANSCCY